MVAFDSTQVPENRDQVSNHDRKVANIQVILEKALFCRLLRSPGLLYLSTCKSSIKLTSLQLQTDIRVWLGDARFGTVSVTELSSRIRAAKAFSPHLRDALVFGKESGVVNRVEGGRVVCSQYPARARITVPMSSAD